MVDLHTKSTRITCANELRAAKIRRQMPRSSIDTRLIESNFYMEVCAHCKMNTNSNSCVITLNAGAAWSIGSDEHTIHHTVQRLSLSMRLETKQGAIILTDTFVMSISFIMNDFQFMRSTALYSQAQPSTSHHKTSQPKGNNQLVKHQQRII